jgi:hypothetical protein
MGPTDSVTQLVSLGSEAPPPAPLDEMAAVDAGWDELA